MSQILIQDKKVIIDGHADNIETCNTLTNLCDELSNSDKFKTIRYESGYGEFESIVENDNKQFVGWDLYVYSNDGSTLLASSLGSISYLTIYVSSNGIGTTAGSTNIYTYSGSTELLGVATSPNQTVPTYAAGSTFMWNTDLSVYIVEAKAVHFKEYMQTPTESTTTTPTVESQSVNVTNYATNNVNSIYEEVSTVAALDAKLIDANIGKMYKYTGTTTSPYYNGGLYICEEFGGLTFTANTAQSEMFYGTTGDYASSSSVTINQTFYTQNAPV